jgi:O-antigen/teichoic acid export membrane protein
MNYIKRVAGHTAIYGLSSVVPRLLNYLLVPLHTRVFLQEDYGIVTEMYAYLAVLIVLLTYGMETGFFRFSSQDKDTNVTYSTAFYSLLFSSSLFILLASFFSNGIVGLIGYSNHPEYVILLASIIGLDAFSTIPFAKLRLQNKPYTFALIKILGVVLNVGFNFFFLLICPKYQLFETIGIYNPDLGITYIFISNLIGTAVSTLVIFFIPGLLPTTFSFSRLKVLFIYSFPLLISGLGGSSNEFFDRIFLKYFSNPELNPLYELGVYGANVKLAVLMTLFIQMYRYAVEPFIFSNIEDKDSPLKYATLTKYFLAFALLIFMGVGLFTEIFQILIGQGFREGIGVVPILLLSNLFLGLYFNFSIWFKVANKTWYGIYYTLTGAIITMTLYVFLIPVIGYYGAAITKLVCYITMSIICYVGGQKRYPVPYEINKFLLLIVTASILFLFGYFININSYAISFIFRIGLILSFIFVFLKIEKISILKLIKSLKQ